MNTTPTNDEQQNAAAVANAMDHYAETGVLVASDGSSVDINQQPAAAGHKYAYSYDGEEYYGEFDSEAAAIAEAASNAFGGDDAHIGTTIHVGRLAPAIEYLRTPSKWPFTERLIECLDERLYDEISSDDRIIEVSREKLHELDKLVLDWLEQNATFNRWGVKDTREHTITAEDLA
jgi:hypothetical protein